MGGVDQSDESREDLMRLLANEVARCGVIWAVHVFLNGGSDLVV